MHSALQPLAEHLRRFSCPVVILDLETTGGNLYHDRITEIAFYRFCNGEVSVFQQLVNPEQDIPRFVEELTGISNEMVADAPTFAETAPHILPLLHNSLIIAHNSRFDYTFLCHEFQRVNIPFGTAALCSVQLSRKLYPDLHKHSLDSIIERHNLPDTDRHRALSDVKILAAYLQIALLERGAPAWQQYAEQLLSPSLPAAHLPEHLRNTLAQLPDSHGVAVWHNAAGAAYRISCHTQAYRELVAELNKAKELPQRLDFVPTVGELHSLSQQAQLMQQHGFTPDAPSGRHSIQVYQYANGCLKVRPKPLAAGFHAHAPHGLFAHPKAAKRALHEWAQAHQLCPKQLNLLPDTLPEHEPCPVSLLHRCDPNCSGHHTETHNQAVKHALAKLPVCDWKQPRLRIRERNPFSGEQHEFLCDSGALHLPDGTWFVSSELIELVKQKFRHHDSGIEILHSNTPFDSLLRLRQYPPTA